MIAEKKDSQKSYVLTSSSMKGLEALTGHLLLRLCGGDYFLYSNYSLLVCAYMWTLGRKSHWVRWIRSDFWRLGGDWKSYAPNYPTPTQSGFPFAQSRPAIFTGANDYGKLQSSLILCRHRSATRRLVVFSGWSETTRLHHRTELNFVSMLEVGYQVDMMLGSSRTFSKVDGD